jgi:ubiquinone/menaquinone biosynthesis C-methylase UbiE
MAEPVVATKEMLEQIFDGAAGLYDATGPSIFRHFGVRLVDLMTLAPGACVLDVGTGKGAVLIPAAQRVRETGRIIGIDLSSAMLEETERTARGAGIANYELHKMDAEHLEFPDASFDAVTCGFSLFFFPAMDAALGEIYRVLKPGGQVGISMWGKAPFGNGWKILAEHFSAYGAVLKMPQRVAYTPENIQALITPLGFIDVHTHAETSEIVYAREEDWWNFQLTLGSRAAILGMDQDTRGRFKEEYLAKVRPFYQADGLHLPAPVIYALARK